MEVNKFPKILVIRILFPPAFKYYSFKNFKFYTKNSNKFFFMESVLFNGNCLEYLKILAMYSKSTTIDFMQTAFENECGFRTFARVRCYTH